MAQAVGHLPLRRAVGCLARPSPAVRYGLKLATALTASIWITFAFALPWGLSVWIAVLFVTQPNAGASIKKGLMRTCGSVAAALVSIAIYGLFSQQPPLMLASLCGALALAVYGLTGPRYPYAWLVFGFTTLLIVVKALAGSDQIETLAFERASLTALGVLIIFVADALFWPVRAEEQLREGLAERSRQLGDALRQHLEARPSGPAAGKPGPPPSSPLIQQLGLVDQFRDEIGATPRRVQGLSRIAMLLEGLASRARLLGHAPIEQLVPAPPARAALAHLGRGLQAALEEASGALAADRAPEPFSEELERSLAGFAGERESTPPSGLTPILQDVVSVLRRLEEALSGLVKQDGEPEARSRSEAVRGAAREWFRPDPIRLQLGLRAGIAGGGVIVAMLAMGWNLEEDMLAMILAPIVAFLLAGMSSTRGAGTTIGIGLASGFLLGWLIADLASVFLFTRLDRMPLSLVYPFAVAGGGGYLIVRGSPLGPLGALFGMLVALLPVYIGDAPPQDVDTAYGLVCGLFVGLTAGLIAQAVLWPRTAMQTFTERAAAQLDLCLRALHGTERAAGDMASLVGAYAKQLTLLGQIHAQAHVEPVERALDDRRRGELLALTQDLFDASLRTPPAPGDAAEPGTDIALAPLRAALQRQDEASGRLAPPPRRSSTRCASTPTPPARSGRAARTPSWPASTRSGSWPPASSRSKPGWRTGAGPPLRSREPELWPLLDPAGHLDLADLLRELVVVVADRHLVLGLLLLGEDAHHRRSGIDRGHAVEEALRHRRLLLLENRDVLRGGGAVNGLVELHLGLLGDRLAGRRERQPGRRADRILGRQLRRQAVLHRNPIVGAECNLGCADAGPVRCTAVNFGRWQRLSGGIPALVGAVGERDLCSGSVC